MADPIINLPPEALRANAEWADRFPGSNAVVRVRHDADTAAYAQALQQQQQDHLDNQIATDRHAAAIYKGQQELDMKRELHARQVALDDQKMQFNEEMHPARMDHLEAQTRAEQALERARITAETRTANVAEQAANAQVELDNHYFDNSVPAGVKAARINALPEKYPMAIHDPSFKERLGQVQKEITPAPVPVIPAGGVVVGGTSRGERYVVPGAVPTKPVKADPAEVINQRIATAPDGMVKYGALSTDGKDVVPSPSNTQATHAKITFQDDHGKYAAHIFPIEEYVAIKAAQNAKIVPHGTVQNMASTAPSFSPGAKAVKNGITYVRGEDGKWLPQ